ncbi:hypothetical protein LMH87_011428 [Akanthomyces muscarius]|uniref:Protein BFR2 n=1 Tax=Akanthomyces muscarius TaxID=2231603 RepID=A0A9W8QAM1_AKAMU|nr:hypothetical protein LMH87_011428 [Akanthomyces muscarius]KAJ4150691.1 hypothetical protein LMH87_011428 [Akanthomyces muscarius]
MGKTEGRSKFFEKFDEHIEKDHDPEAEQVVGSGSEEDSGDENIGTEHYVNVGKSKLRDKGENSLGPQYRGSKVSRTALEQESSDEEEEADDDDDNDEQFDDPETANLEADTAEASDSEISSDDALGDSDNEKLSKFVFRGSSNPKKSKNNRATAADFMSDSVEEFEDDGEDDEEDDEEDDDMDDGLEALIDGEAEESGEDEDDEDDDDDDEEDDEDQEDEDEDGEEQNRSNAKAAANGRTPNADIEKGAAIQKQRKLYDGLLNLRIRLQKALIAANTFSALEDEQEEDDTTTASYNAAEATALSLLNTISSLRENCGAPAVAGTKRKRGYEVSATSAEIWAQLQEEDRRALKFREKCLEKWSRKVQSVNVTAPKGINRNKTLVESLHDQLNNPENRLAKRTRVPRSCAPAQHGKKMAEDETIFDDADFYQILLKELVEQRTVDSSSNQASAVPSVVLTASRENRTRKIVDRKASKGRKMRFTVHEKLQNFMAPEDRRQWEQSAIDRFFSTLFGRKLEFNEDEADEDEAMTDVADPNFKLFA